MKSRSKAYHVRKSMEVPLLKDGIICEERVGWLGWKQVTWNRYAIPEIWVELVYGAPDDMWQIAGDGSWFGTIFRGEIKTLWQLHKLMEWTGINEALKQTGE